MVVSGGYRDGGVTGLLDDGVIRKEDNVVSRFSFFLHLSSGSRHLRLLLGLLVSNLLPFLYHGHGFPLFRRVGGLD